MTTKTIFIASVLTTLTLTGCIDFDDATQPISVEVQVQMPDELAGAELAGHTVTMTLNGQAVAATTDASGIATFTNIVPDVYDISTAWKMTSQEYAALTGHTVQNGKYTVAGSLNAQTLAAATGEHIVLSTSVSRDQSILISKVYFAGSKDNNNRNYIAGKYVELYNNSDETVDVAGLYLALMESESTIAYTPGQVADTIFAKQVFRLPVSTPHPVAPGGTVLLVNSAIDHSSQGPNECSLLDADYEAKDESGRTVNNPSVPALELIYCTYQNLTYMNLLQGGPTSLVIFSTDENVGEWPTAYAYGKTRGNRFMQIPAAAVIDGVDILTNKAQTGVDTNTKRLFDYIDGGYVNINATTGYNGEKVYRKTASTDAGGRRILTDTNNSLNDFDVTTDINPRAYK